MEQIRSMNLSEMETLMKSMHQPTFRAKQLFAWIHGKGVAKWEQMHNLGKNLLEQLQETVSLQPLQLEARQTSADGTEKFLFKLEDGQAIECVLMRYRGDQSKQRNTLCISSQVGCAMGCTFCATGKGGFVRNLTAGEIVSQIYEVNGILAEEGESLSIGNVVYMGMGEPLLNLEAVLRSIALLNDPMGQQIGIRRITVSTCGIVPKIKELAQAHKDVVLAISLHAPNDELRSSIMPINRQYSIEVLMDACRRYQRETGNRISFEYALMKGFNDNDTHVRQLKDILKGLDCHLNIIPVNPVEDGSPYARPSKKEVSVFMQKLKQVGINSSAREEKGMDIDGACGQLRGKLQRVQKGERL